MAATVGLVKLFGKTIPVPVEVDMRLDPFKETGGGWGAVRGGEDKDDDSVKDNPVPAVESSEEGESQSFSSSALHRSIADNGGKSKKPPKPEKILPCPRCDSMATKFCYYNNYNLNQPRHFCKNCQRYWTAGGSMRNVPVGAGRRRNKNSGALFRHITVVKAPFSTEEMPNSALGDGSINVSPWAFPFSFYPMAGFMSVPCTSPSSPPAVAESEKRLWFPKTLRIDDPAEAAKSSIWATMGFSKDVAGRGGLFNGFDQHKVNHSSAMAEGPRVFHANPAAVSRSFCFQKNAILE